MKTDKKENHPNNFKLLDELNICSNRIIGGGNIVGIDGFAPILIGDGIVPSIWLYTRDDKNKWIKVIDNNQTTHHEISILKDELNREIIIGFKNIIILRAKMISNKICTINIIDLRPIGFEIHGKNGSLYIAGNTFSGNTFQGISFMVGFNNQK